MNQMTEVQAFITSIFHTKFDDLDFDGIIEHVKLLKETTPSASRSNAGGWQSPIITDKYDNPLIEKMFEDKINLNAFGLFNFVLKHSKCFKKVHYWYNVNTPNSYNMLHTHARSMMSGVIYIKVPENSGNIVFERPEYEVIELSDINDANSITNPYNNTRYWFKPEQGKMILFPSYTAHYVEQNKSNEDRISISFNFVG